VAPTSEVVSEIMAALADDLDTPRAISSIFAWVAATESEATGGSAGEMARAFDSALGLAF